MKRPQDVFGYKRQCPDFDQCPFCYGCRAYDPKYLKCQHCYEDDKKKNICNTKKHRPEAIAKMLTRQKIDLE